MGTMAIITLLVETTNQLLKKMPDYDERERKKWEKVLVLYQKEIVKPKEDWDADLLLNIRDEIIIRNKKIVGAAKNG